MILIWMLMVLIIITNDAADDNEDDGDEDQSYQVIIVGQLFERWANGSTDTKQMMIMKMNHVAGCVN